MTDKLQRDIQRGERAKRLLSDDLITEARTHIEAELWRLFKDTLPSVGHSSNENNAAMIARRRLAKGGWWFIGWLCRFPCMIGNCQSRPNIARLAR